jgi:predicted transcriptional regulator
VALTASPIPASLKNLKLDTKMCELDYKIIQSLKDNSRKATSDVAEELGVSAKTVRHRLSRMERNYLIQTSIDWFPDASNDIISVFHINLKPTPPPTPPT